MPKLQSSPCLAVYIAEALMGNLIAWHFTMVSTFSTQRFVSWIVHPKVCQILVLWTSGATLWQWNKKQFSVVPLPCIHYIYIYYYIYIYIYIRALTMLMKWQYRSMAIESRAADNRSWMHDQEFGLVASTPRNDEKVNWKSSLFWVGFMI